MPRMRIPVVAFNEIKAFDPDTALTMNGFRRLLRTGKVHTVKIGRKTLVNYDALVAYLTGPTDTSVQTAQPAGGGLSDTLFIAVRKREVRNVQMRLRVRLICVPVASQQAEIWIPIFPSGKPLSQYAI